MIRLATVVGGSEETGLTRLALGPIALVIHCRKTTAAGVPSLICVAFENVGPNLKMVSPDLGLFVML